MLTVPTIAYLHYSTHVQGAVNQSCLSANACFLAAALCLSFTCLLSGSQGSAEEIEHVVVRKPNSGRAFGWPANGAIWNWGDEILVVYFDCPYEDFGWFGRWLASPISGFGKRLHITRNTIRRSGGPVVIWFAPDTRSVEL
jgi:hypothetical protein